MSTTSATANPVNNLQYQSVATASSAAASAATATGANQALGASDFLSMLTTELKNQDPLNPMDDTQSVAQLAQFSSLQATETMSTQFSNFESNFAVSQASGMLGDSVTVSTTDATGNSSNVSGTVKSIQVINGAPQFTMTDASGNAIVDGTGTPIEFSTSQITAITK